MGAILAPLAALVVAAAPHAAPMPPGVSWSCDFEATYCGMEEQSKAEPGRRSVFTATPRDGQLAVELTTVPRDDQVHGSGEWERDDLALPPSPAYCNEGQEEWWAVSVLFPEDYAPSVLGEVMDFHHHADGGQANFNVVAVRDHLRLHGFYGDVKRPGEYKVELGPIHRDTWYDFVYHVKWTSHGNGFFEAWLNGRQVLAHEGPTLYPGISCYFKLANYHAPTGRPSSIVFDRVVRGTSRAAVTAERHPASAALALTR
ncbi:MAG TPA: heparin lyase I family protein [Usitatibacter sp.]